MRASSRWLLVTVVLAALLQGCASSHGVASAADPRDPWEGMNRKVFAFNEKLDEVVVRPYLGHRTEDVERAKVSLDDVILLLDQPRSVLIDRSVHCLAVAYLDHDIPRVVTASWLTSRRFQRLPPSMSGAIWRPGTALTD